MDYRKTLEQVMELLNNAEELNMNNYNEEQVRLLNDTFIEVYLFIERALAEPSNENAVLPIHSVRNSLPFIDLEVCERLALETDYACEAVGEEINTGDAGAFFLEGYEYAKKLLGNDC